MTTNSRQETRSRQELDPVVLLTVLFVLGVLILHHSGYTRDYLSFLWNFRVHLWFQKLVVGGFFFLSGYKLAGSKRLVSNWQFVQNRFWKLYPLYFVALIAFSFTVYPHHNQGQLPSLENFAVHSLLSQAVFPDLFGRNFSTVWFVSILFCCYIFFLITRKIVERGTMFLAVSALVLASGYAAHQLIAYLFDIQFFCRFFNLYLAFFGLGMLFATHKDFARAVRSNALCGCFVVGLAGIICLYNAVYINTWYEQLVEFILLLLATVPFYILLFKHARSVTVTEGILTILLGTIVYIAYAVFLFHRPIWTIMHWFWPEESFAQWMFIVPFGTIVVLIVSFGCQWTFDRTVSFFQE